MLRDRGRVRQVIGVVSQKHGADLNATGRENLVLQGAFYGISGSELRRRSQESLERFGLADVADRPASSYSGGMQRRLDIALGLLHRPRVLFLDEPTTGLDPEVRHSTWQQIRRLAEEERMTILLTTHYMEEADELASELAIIDRGRVVAQGSPRELKAALEGDTLRIELERAHSELAREAVSRVAGLADISVEGQLLSASTADGATTLPAVLAALEAHGVKARSVTVARPSLDAVYLRHTGRAFEPAGETLEEVAA